MHFQGIAMSGPFTCDGGCCTIDHHGSGIRRLDLTKVCFDSALHLVSLQLLHGGM
jgi:hypothetical protein